ncbi:MAG: class B sortase [Oscillospiraceae bacterium]|nr:class B sortase [Oscillospiraceae bacterium]
MKKAIHNILFGIFAAVFLVSAIYLGNYALQSFLASRNNNALADIMDENAVTPRPTINEFPTETTPEEPETQPTEPVSNLVQITDPETGEIVEVLPEFQELYLLNNDIVGWMQIPGTDINYPVMQTPDEPNFYLDHDFDKKSSKHGALYAREQCDINRPSANITIYGHRMKDRSMFAQLDKYMEKSFFEENPYIYFDTLTELHTYKIVAVFLTTATYGKGFPYQRHLDNETTENYISFIDTCKDLALYDTGVTAEPGDKFITLSTCEYSQENGRLVVVAKRIG